MYAIFILLLTSLPPQSSLFNIGYCNIKFFSKYFRLRHDIFCCTWERANKVYRNLVFMMFGVNECVFLDLLFFWVWCIIINIKPTPNTKYVIYSKYKTFIILQNVICYDYPYNFIFKHYPSFLLVRIGLKIALPAPKVPGTLIFIIHTHPDL